ncbi:MAG: tyrosine-type recombinase/integrase [Rhizobiaceae bacterium]|nr:tyrosine-type recombinase/integrase [Rhizobiaceae bacterium]
MRYTKSASYIFTKRGIYYFSRRIPEDLKSHYNLTRIVISLRTRSHQAAVARASSLKSKLDEDWIVLRWRSSSAPFKKFLVDKQGLVAPGSIPPTTTDAPPMAEAKELYLKAKNRGRPKTFIQGVDRAVRYMTDLLGDKPINAYSRLEINQLRDVLAERGLAAASIKRNFNVLRALVNFTTQEHGLPDINVFTGIYLGEPQASLPNKRLPLPLEYIRKIQCECREIDDEARWLIALISDTGMRLSEAAGLTSSDIKLQAKHPHILLKPHPWRRLKTSGSERVVPLVGVALWAADRATGGTKSRFLFPKYCNNDGCKANTASAALNKWLTPRVPKGCVVHSFRHSMRDRLRAVECPPDIIDRIGGWSVQGVGETYGAGYPLSILSKWLHTAIDV